MSGELHLRRIDSGDWRAIHDWARLEDSSRYQAWGPNTETETQAFVDGAVAGWERDPVCDRVYVAEVDGDVIGNGVLHIRDRHHSQGEISYGIHPKLWGQGLGTALGGRLLDLGFAEHGLHRIAATCDPRNIASAAVLRKLGLTYEGTMRHTMKIADRWRDSQLYAVLRHEWTDGDGD